MRLPKNSLKINEGITQAINKSFLFLHSKNAGLMNQAPTEEQSHQMNQCHEMGPGPILDISHKNQTPTKIPT